MFDNGTLNTVMYLNESISFFNALIHKLSKTHNQQGSFILLKQSHKCFHERNYQTI